MKQPQSALVLDRIAGDVKFWSDGRCPGVDEVRPCQCSRCGAASHREGKVLLQGHGVVVRQRLGPASRGEAPQVALQRVRRYRCQACGCVMRVTHRALLRYKHYGASVIGEALGRWGLLREPAAKVRRALSPWRPGPASTGWRSLKRWTGQAAAGRIWQAVASGLRAPVRELAERVSRVLVALGQQFGGGLQAQLWEAAMLAR